MTILLGILEQGLVYGILALGLYITYTILNFPDLTVDGSFPLGASVAVALITAGINPLLALAASFAAGVLAGTITGLIHVKLGVRNLLSGIIVMTGLYTINLWIAGQANVPIFANDTIFNNDLTKTLLPASLSSYTKIIVIIFFAFLMKLLLDAYLTTKSGYLLKASGDNEILVKTMAKNPGALKIIGLSIANGLVALAGGILMQHQRFFEISMGTGSMVIGLASVIIGMKLFQKIGFLKPTTKVLLGSVIYNAIVAAAIAIGLSAQSMKLITAVLFLAVLVFSQESPFGKKVRNA
ncbi:MAG: ABC transporter permease [Gallicola sp.]|nr:ABC transporter permease [Gallicola sp.]